MPALWEAWAGHRASLEGEKAKTVLYDTGDSQAIPQPSTNPA